MKMMLVMINMPSATRLRTQIKNITVAKRMFVTADIKMIPIVNSIVKMIVGEETVMMKMCKW